MCSWGILYSSGIAGERAVGIAYCRNGLSRGDELPRRLSASIWLNSSIVHRS